MFVSFLRVGLDKNPRTPRINHPQRYIRFFYFFLSFSTIGRDTLEMRLVICLRSLTKRRIRNEAEAGGVFVLHGAVSFGKFLFHLCVGFDRRLSFVSLFSPSLDRSCETERVYTPMMAKRLAEKRRENSRDVCLSFRFTWRMTSAFVS